jgi:hypothetical protein
MTEEPQAIEVEVVEIDGLAPPVKSARPEDPTPDPQARWQDWGNLQGRVLQLDKRWWPLWAVVGIVALALLLTVGVVLGIVFVIFRIIGGFIRAILGK